MITAVLDTNVIVSRIIESRGIPHLLLEAARSQRFALVTSPALIAEVLGVLSRERIRRKYLVTAADIERFRTILEHETIQAPGTYEVHGVATHPEDDLILATAVEGRADYLVTGDAHLQQLRTYKAVIIVSPRVFLGVLESHSL